MALVIIDTGPLVALLDRREAQHTWATESLRNLRRPFLTCDAVLTEACFLLAGQPHAHRNLWNLLERKLIVSSFESAPQAPAIFDLMERYQSIPMSFADACLVRMVESNPGSRVFTLDRDFSLYRQQRRRIIPLIAPFD